MDLIRLAELTGAVARAADAGIGFPPETSLRLCLVAVGLARSVGLSDEEVRDVYHAALLRHAGCTASAHEETRLAGDEIELRVPASCDLPLRLRGLYSNLEQERQVS